MYAVPGTPFVLKGPEEKMKNLLGDNISKFIPLSIISEDELEEKNIIEGWSIIIENIKFIKESELDYNFFKSLNDKSNVKIPNSSDSFVKKLGDQKNLK